MKSATATRPYQMRVRAEAAAETEERILDAATKLFWERPVEQLSLDEVARRADVSVRTVIRRFGSKEGLMAAGAAREQTEVRAQRDQAPIGDIPAAVAVLVEHYEMLGDRVIRLLAAADGSPALADIAEQGRTIHRQWCRRVFAPGIAGLPPTDRRRRLAQLAAVCDVYTWKLLRRDAGLSRRQTELALIEMLTPLTKES